MGCDEDEEEHKSDGSGEWEDADNEETHKKDKGSDDSWETDEEVETK